MYKILKFLLLLVLSSNLLFAVSIKTVKDSYARGESITVQVSDLPKTKKCNLDNLQNNNDCSWVGLFYAFDGSEAQNLLSHQYTAADGEATFTFSGLDEAQEYEARVFFKNNYTEQGFYNFKVTTDQYQKEIQVKTLKNSYKADESITVSVSGLPGNINDWVGIFKAYDGSYAQNLITKIETNGTKEGNFTFPALNIAAEYEVRAFSKGTFVEEDYFPFEVTPVPQPVTPCNILQNPSFETDTSGWSVYGNNTLVNDGYDGNKALRIKNGGLDQMSQKVTGDVDTYQFNGYYKTTGTTDGIWVGMIFYDTNKNTLLEKYTYLKDTNSYTKFIINATATPETKYIETWIWSSAEEHSGKVLFDNLKLSTLGCYNYTVASSLPPKGLKPTQVPQFVVLGFDDNTDGEGIDWAIDLFEGKHNRDGTDARVSFYLNTIRLHDNDADAAALLAAMQRLKNTSHEMGNHTDDHMRYLYHGNEDDFFRTLKTLDYDSWSTHILAATNDLTDIVGVNANDMQGFRTTYLLYNYNSMSVLKNNGFIYDCSIEEGYSPEFDGTNFRWPYQLNEGSPGHNESWYGNPDNDEQVDIKTIDGLWELPNYVVMIPKDSECADYGIKRGFWDRLVKNVSYPIENHRMTGLDYNLWVMGKINKAEMLGLLKYNLDLRLKGNRSPFMFGTHSQYYVKEWADENVPNATAEEMREAIGEFVDYALSKDVVRIRPSIDIINWCKNPQAL